MNIIKGDDIAAMTGYTKPAYQQKWFNDKGITYQINAKGEVWTTDDWLNGKDKYQVSNDDGFNLNFLDHPRDTTRWMEENILLLPTTLDELRLCLSYDLKKHPAVYFLFDCKDSIVYVGKCKNPYKRMIQHKSDKTKNYDLFGALYDVPACSSENVEAFYISLFKPKYNQVIPDLCRSGFKRIKEVLA